MKLAIFLPNWVGDLVMATPALRAVRRHFPSAQIMGVGRPMSNEVLAGTHWLDSILPHAPQSGDPAHSSWTVIARLRAERPDLVLLLTHSLRTGLMARLSGAPWRVGFAKNGRSILLTDRIHFHRKGRRRAISSALDDYLKLAYAVGCSRESPRLELATTQTDEQAADLAWRSLGLPAGERVVVINSSGAFGTAKLWPSESFAALARRIAQEQHLPVVVLCGPAERPIAEQIAALAAHPKVKSLANQPLSLGLSKACVRRSRLLVTTDSGPRHFAAAFGVPVVTLFGPTHQGWSETHYARALHVQHEVPCGPCQKRVCPLGHHRCMRDLSVEQVYRAVAAQLEVQGDVRAA